MPEPRRVVVEASRAVPRWAAIARTPRAHGGPAVSYGHTRVPGSGEPVNGGMVKFQRLDREWRNEPRRFNLLYLGSGTLPWDWRVLLRLARRRGARVLLNQNGVAYPGWAGDRTDAVNEPMARVLHDADHVFFQSAFCRLAADTFLGPREGPGEVLHNAVDTRVFVPGEPRRGGSLTLLLGGSQYERYRLETAFRTLAALLREGLDARLLVTGALTFLPDRAAARRAAGELAAGLGLEGRFEFLGPYTQAEAPGVLRRGDILLHTKVNDPCPGLVAEAMACGLPVVYSASGGVPELVGEDAGVGVETPLRWDEIVPPDPEALARAVLAVRERLDEHREAARGRAVEQLDIEPWLRRHAEVFTELLR